MEKLWKAPELIILARRKSDEAILAYCKDCGSGADGSFSGCYRNQAAGGWQETVCAYYHCSYVIT